MDRENIEVVLEHEILQIQSSKNLFDVATNADNSVKNDEINEHVLSDVPSLMQLADIEKANESISNSNKTSFSNYLKELNDCDSSTDDCGSDDKEKNESKTNRVNEESVLVQEEQQIQNNCHVSENLLNAAAETASSSNPLLTNSIDRDANNEKDNEMDEEIFKNLNKKSPLSNFNEENENISKFDKTSFSNYLKELNDDDDSTDDYNSDDNREEKSQEKYKNNDKESKTIKLSAAEAESQRREIKSKTQKLKRESHVNIPYHEPKRFTLKEFLSRRTLLKSEEKPNVKMNENELKKYSKYLEDRAKEAEEFFRGNVKDEKNNLEFSEMEKHNDNHESLVSCENHESLVSEPIAGTSKDINSCSLTLLKDDTSKDAEISVTPQSVCLKSNSNAIIELEIDTFVKSSGINMLFANFLKTQKRKPVAQNNSINILSTDNGKIEIMSAKISESEKDELVEPKPGLAHLKLKQNLEQLIKQKRKKEIVAKLERNKINEKDNSKNISDEEINEEYDDFNDADDEGDEYNDLEEDECNDIEENEEYNDADDENEEYNDADDENCENEEYNDADDENYENESEQEYVEEKAKTKSSNLFQNDNESNVIDELDSSLKLTKKQESGIQVPTKQLSQNIDENELMDLCSGKFTNNIEENLPTENLNLQTSDDDNDIIKKRTFKKKKMKYISDDDDDDDNENIKEQQSSTEILENKDEDENEGEDESAEEQNEEDIQERKTYIDYDSEENEIEVEINKNEYIDKPEDFLDKEAELSESEWGSADEDEKDLDRYDIELGDEDEFNQTELRRELEKIHMRKILDQDIREVKKLQELFFDDEENDGIGRKKQFRWSHLNKEFSLESDKSGLTEEIQNNEEDNNDGNEELWRKVRYEREKLLKENTVDSNSSNSKMQNIMSFHATEKRLTIIKSINNRLSNSNEANEIKSPFLISKLELGSNRGSFLIRDDETLSKLNSSMKLSNIDKDMLEDNITNIKTIKTNNFVFTTTENYNKNLKRKITDNENDVQKKPKKGRLISQLC